MVGKGRGIRTGKRSGYEDRCETSYSAYEGGISDIPGFRAKVGVRVVTSTVYHYTEDYEDLYSISF